MLQKIGEAAARGKMNFSELEKWAQGTPVRPACQSNSCGSRSTDNNYLWIKDLTVTWGVGRREPISFHECA